MICSSISRSLSSYVSGGEMDAREAAMACQWLGLRYAIPCHHDDPALPEIVPSSGRIGTTAATAGIPQDYIQACLEAGMASGEFCDVPVAETAYVLISMINGEPVKTRLLPMSLAIRGSCGGRARHSSSDTPTSLSPACEL